MRKNCNAIVYFGFLLLWLSFLQGCTMWMAYDITTVNPKPDRGPSAPRASGTLLAPELRVGISPDYAPLAYKEQPFGLVGVEVDFANQLGRSLGKNIVFVETPFPELIPALLDNRIDIIMSGMSATGERLQLVNFTNSYATIGQMALVRIENQNDYPSAQSFLSVTSRIGFVRTTTGEMAAKAFFPKATLTPQETIESGIESLRKKEIALFIHDAPTVWRVANNPGEKELTGLYWPLTKEPLVWAVRKDDEPLRFAINRELEKWRNDGSVKQILSRWAALRIWD